MARIRTVKPDLFTDAKMVKMSVHARLLFIGLFCQADRDGRFEWQPEEIKMRILPLDDIEISDTLAELEKSGRVVRYDNGNHGYIPNFSKHQVINPREQESKLPDPNPKKSVTRAHASRRKEGRKEGKGKERKGRKEIDIGDASIATPADKARWFFSAMAQRPLPDDAKHFLVTLVEKTGSGKEVVWHEVQKFVAYWTEKTKSGKKERWEKQDTFEVDRRLSTWFGNIKDRAVVRQQKGREIIM